MISSILAWDDHLLQISKLGGVKGKTFEYYNDNSGNPLVHDMNKGYLDLCDLDLMQDVRLDRDNFFVRIDAIPEDTSPSELWSFSMDEQRLIAKW